VGNANVADAIASDRLARRGFSLTEVPVNHSAREELLEDFD